MKKLTILMMGLAVIIAITACGNKDSKTATEATTTPAAATTKAATGGQQVVLKATNFQFDKTEYRIKKGESVTITLDNSQGIHGASIKEFNINLNNGNKTVTFTPDKTGSFPITCSIMCGSGHASMKTTLIVE